MKRKKKGFQIRRERISNSYLDAKQLTEGHRFTQRVSRFSRGNIARITDFEYRKYRAGKALRNPC